MSRGPGLCELQEAKGQSEKHLPQIPTKQNIYRPSGFAGGVMARPIASPVIGLLEKSELKVGRKGERLTMRRVGLLGDENDPFRGSLALVPADAVYISIQKGKSLYVVSK